MAPGKMALSQYRMAASNIIARDQVVTVPRIARALKVHSRTMYNRLHVYMPWFIEELQIVRGTKIDKDLNDQSVRGAAELLLRSDGIVTPKRIAEVLEKKENTILVYLRNHPSLTKKYRIVRFNRARVIIAAYSIPKKERTVERVLAVFREKYGFGSVASIRLYMRTHTKLLEDFDIIIRVK